MILIPKLNRITPRVAHYNSVTISYSGGETTNRSQQELKRRVCVRRGCHDDLSCETTALNGLSLSLSLFFGHAFLSSLVVSTVNTRGEAHGTTYRSSSCPPRELLGNPETTSDVA